MLFLLWGACAFGEVMSIYVNNENEMKNAVGLINTYDEGEFIIVLNDDIEMSTTIDFSSAATKTILGNDKTLSLGKQKESQGSSDDYKDSFIVLWNGRLNLGDESGSGLTIRQKHGITGGDSSSCIQVIANNKGGTTNNPVLNMYEGVTIDSWTVNNSYGAAVRLHSHQFDKELTSTFNMYGGTIKNCGYTYDYGSNRIGGGVAVMYNGEFYMYGGGYNRMQSR